MFPLHHAQNNSKLSFSSHRPILHIYTDAMGFFREIWSLFNFLWIYCISFCLLKFTTTFDRGVLVAFHFQINFDWLFENPWIWNVVFLDSALWFASQSQKNISTYSLSFACWYRLSTRTLVFHYPLSSHKQFSKWLESRLHNDRRIATLPGLNPPIIYLGLFLHQLCVVYPCCFDFYFWTCKQC